MASTKISIIKTSSVGPKYGIDRAMPVMMKRRMGENEWEQFCNQVDNVMEPFHKPKCEDLVIAIGFTFSLPLFILIIIFAPSLYFLFIPSALMICTCLLIDRAASKKRSLYDQLRQLCEVTSRANDEISFHFRDGVIQGSESANYFAPFFIEACIRTIDVIVVAGIRNSNNDTIQAMGHPMTIFPFAKVITADAEGTPAREREADYQKDVEKDMESACSSMI
ncbi:hypothetical protein IV203_015905 [Nitzschia inconspicua]|uniref:Uncharacterized protein n=1 Tax=Nitzschia inconspicua TaxID=303405 RepID=A0A9K3LE45_9STRA|nr:hypothetical protein IV203_015905 [Nitzschia inconspicua]